MKKYGVILVLAWVMCLLGCSDEDSSENINRYETFSCDTEFKHYGISKDGNDLDAVCHENGENKLSFVEASLDVDHAAVISYSCFSICNEQGAKRGSCRNRDFTDYPSSSFHGIADVTIVYTCRDIDGKIVYAPSEYQRCLNACNAEGTACE